MGPRQARLATLVYKQKAPIVKDYVTAFGKTVSKEKVKRYDFSIPQSGNKTGLKPLELTKNLFGL